MANAEMAGEVLGIDLAIPGTDQTVLMVGRRRDGKATNYMLEQLRVIVQNEALPTDKGAALELAAKALAKAFGWSFDRALESVSFAAKVVRADAIAVESPTEEDVRMRWCGNPEPNRDAYDRGLIAADIAVQEAKLRALRCGEIVVDWMIEDDEEETNFTRLPDGSCIITDIDGPAATTHTAVLAFTIGDPPPWPLVAKLGLAKGSDWEAVDAKVKGLKDQAQAFDMGMLAEMLGCDEDWDQIHSRIVSLNALQPILGHLRPRPGDSIEVVALTWGRSMSGAITAELKVKRGS